MKHTKTILAAMFIGCFLGCERKPDDIYRSRLRSYKDLEGEAFEYEDISCKVKLNVVPLKGRTKKTFKYSDNCPDQIHELYKAIDVLLEKISGRFPVTDFDAMIMCDSSLAKKWSESMALASLKSKSWQKFLKKKYAKTLSELYVDVFNEFNVGRDLQDVFAKHHWKLSLFNVEKVLTAKGSLLAFAKKNPTLSRTRQRVLVEAGCYYFGLRYN